jgi:hypothetical protein
MAMLVITRWYIHMLPFNMVIMACLKYPAQDVNLWLVRTSIYSKKQTNPISLCYKHLVDRYPVYPHDGSLWIIMGYHNSQ